MNKITITQEEKHKLAVLDTELEAIATQVRECCVERQRLDKRLNEITKREQVVRSEIILLKRILSKHSWRYESDCRLCGYFDDYPGLSDALGRFDNHHAYFQLEENVQLCLCDSSLFINFFYDNTVFKPGTKERDYAQETINTRNKMRDFIKKWGIVLKTKDLEEERVEMEKKLQQISCLLATLKDLQ